MTEISSPAEQKCETEEQTKEICIIVPTETSPDPDAVMILLCDTHLAETAMLTSSRLDEVASTTDLARTVEYVVIGILSHVPFVVIWSNNRGLNSDASIGEEVG